MKKKANKTGFTLLSYPSKKSYIKIFSDSAYENTLTPQQHSRETYEKVTLLETTVHKDSNKIWFGIFRAIYK